MSSPKVYLDAQAGEVGNANLAWAMLMPALDPIRCDPRFRAAIVKLYAKDLRAATICGEKRTGP